MVWRETSLKSAEKDEEERREVFLSSFRDDFVNISPLFSKPLVLRNNSKHYK